jgi:gamma-glutamylcyclotransferase
MSKKTQLYFCYGDEMNGELIRSICDNPVFVGIARLPDYRLVFVGHSKKWDGADEALVNSPGSEVWGVVYQLGLTDGDSLDLGKDIRLNGTGQRFHYPADVFASDGSSCSILFYQKAELGEPKMPSREYLDFIVAGAVERGLPPSYVKELRKTPSRSASYPVPRKSNIDFSVLSGLSCDCGG